MKKTLYFAAILACSAVASRGELTFSPYETNAISGECVSLAFSDLIKSASGTTGTVSIGSILVGPPGSGHGRITLSQTNFNYCAQAGFVGGDSFKFFVSDSLGQRTVGQVKVKVTKAEATKVSEDGK